MPREQNRTNPQQNQQSKHQQGATSTSSRYQPYPNKRNTDSENFKTSKDQHYGEKKGAFRTSDGTNASYGKISDNIPKTTKIITPNDSKQPHPKPTPTNSNLNINSKPNSSSENMYQIQRERNTSKYGKATNADEEDLIIPTVEDDENLQLMKALGLPTQFDTTHEKFVPGKAHHLSGVKITSKRKVRQVMNLKDKPTHNNKPRFQ
ncbi:hypothetical protein C9374_012530 [Naegleria lovaniensis]|uniref:U4/U6.U5 small nuclear ribonucleoprotein 27kDa protein domain-containing protein n=1 Tax=Naegleria lovaniensis TaxID=51637 RepID=A0AA88GZZ2_NAELO|nr:uncharacterized protein C9374_012530 [Naegleria lovaniensis]KAG2392278.1 hypothetical protein C9374_012530 [Naegleria lovaniensis]